MRIIAGAFKSRRLESLEGNNTRPTLDKIKESIFSSIYNELNDGIALDLFSGSGSIGLECLSRGMSHCVFNDKNKKAIEIINKNIKLLDVKKRSTVYNLDYKNLLLKLKNQQFDFIYLDPPYALNVYDGIMNQLNDLDLVKENGIVILESSNEDIFNEKYGMLTKFKEKEYGITRITYYRR